MNASPTAATPAGPFVPRRPRWPARRRRAVRLGGLAAMAAALGGCVGFTEPVAGLSGRAIDPSPYIGTWSIEPSTSIVVEAVGDGTGALTGTARDVTGGGYDAPPVTFTARLSDIDGRIVASVLVDDGSGSDVQIWTVVSLALADDGAQLTLRGLDVDGIAAAVASGELPGRPVDRGGEYGLFGAILFAADGRAVSEYLSRHPDLFVGPDETTLTRGDPQPAAPSGDPDPAFLPSANRATARADAVGVPPPQPPDRLWQGYPAMPTIAPAWLPPTEPERSSSGMGFASGVPTSPGAMDAAPSGTVPGAAADAGLPAPVKGILAALGLLIVVGIVVAVALDAAQKRPWARRDNAAGSDADGMVGADDGAHDGAAGAGMRRLSPVGALRRNVWPALLVLVVAVAPILYLGVLLGSLAFPSWIVLQPGTQGMLHALAPYVLVFSIGALIAVAEVVTTFPTFPAEALATKWATALVAFNALGTTIAYSAVVTYASNDDHPLLRALAVAAGFAVLIRTRFVLARGLRAADAGDGVGAGVDVAPGERPGDGVSIDLGWPYARIQQLCRQRIDRELLRDPGYATACLLDRFPDAAALRRIASDGIRSRAAAGPDGAPDADEMAALRARLDAIGAADDDPGIVRARLARFAVAAGGLDHVRFVLEHAEAGDHR